MRHTVDRVETKRYPGWQYVRFPDYDCLGFFWGIWLVPWWNPES